LARHPDDVPRLGDGIALIVAGIADFLVSKIPESALDADGPMDF